MANDNTIYRWVKASEIKIDYRKKYIAKRADDETIFFTGRFQESDGVFFWEGHSGYVPMKKEQYDVLLILLPIEADQELWKGLLSLARSLAYFEDAEDSVRYNDTLSEIKSKYTLIKNS